MARFDEAQKRAFLDQQFAAQYVHYGIHYPTCERNIIERDGEPIGRLWVTSGVTRSGWWTSR